MKTFVGKVFAFLIGLSLASAQMQMQMRGRTRPNPVLFQLGKHDVHQNHITLSGFSSGGTFVQQMLIAYSSLITGVASFSHAYYRCGPGTARERDYDNACTIIGAANLTYNPDNAIEDIRLYERSGLIDSTANLRDKRLYIYAGARSEVFSLDQSLGAVRVFEPFIRDPCAIRTRVQDATQLMPTDRFGAPCSMSAADNLSVGNCGFSGAFEGLNFLLGDVIRAPMATTRPRLNHLLRFDQTEFFYGYNGDAHMDSVGFMYIPRQCQTQKCFLHFYFHGCSNGREFNGTDHVVQSGFLELAEVNNLIVVFPQVLSNPPENRIGCWDTYGLTGQLYATKLGAQVRVVRNMIARILGTDNNPDVPEPERDYDSNRIKKREREPLGLQFQIFKGKEVILKSL